MKKYYTMNCRESLENLEKDVLIKLCRRLYRGNCSFETLSNDLLKNRVFDRIIDGIIEGSSEIYIEITNGNDPNLYEIVDFSLIDSRFKISETIKFQRDLPILKKDSFYIETHLNLDTDRAVVMYHENTCNRIGYLNLILDESRKNNQIKRYFFASTPNQIDYDKLEKVTSVDILFPRKRKKFILKTRVNVDIVTEKKQTVKKEHSNTLMGGKSNIVNVDIVTEKKHTVEKEHSNTLMDDKFDISETIKFQRDLPILKKDGFYIETHLELDTDREVELCRKNSSNRIGYLNLILDESTKDNQIKRYFLTSTPDKIDYDELERVASVDILFPVKNEEAMLKSSVNVDMVEPNYSDTTSSSILAIDFGTSNTTAGSFRGIDDIDIVTFETYKNNELSKIYPTIVYVKDCSNPEEIEYLFGYQAKREIEKNNYLPEASFFYTLKKWVYSPDKIEIINDKEGNRAKVSRRSIIKAYIQNVIFFAKHHFGKDFKAIHFSTPVKQKDAYIRLFEELFGDKYHIIPAKESIDEGMSIVYSYIRSSLKNTLISNKKLGKRKLLIIDSGGGTTDLSSVKFGWKQKRDRFEDYELDITTGYENGASNFGGNNITYRIFKFIKIKLANIYEADGLIETDIKKLFGKTNINSMLKDIDINNSIDNIYKKFEETYKIAEKIIPTQFADSKRFSGKNTIRAVKQNFYLLWEIAEIIKIEFFKQSNIERISFDEEKLSEGKIRLPKIESYDISIFRDNKIIANLKDENNPIDFSIGLQEIKSIILPEIYYVIKKLIGNDKSIERNEYNAVVLSGQTSKINLYSELLKEFIPGKKLREALNEADLNSSENMTEEDTLKLKLKCVEGAIVYFMDKEYGKIIPNIINENKKIHYRVKIDRSIDGKELWMYELNDEEQLTKINFQLFDIRSAGSAKFVIVSNDNNISKVYDYKFKGISDTFTTLDNIKEDIKKYISSDIADKLAEDLNSFSEYDNKKIILAIPDIDRYGFYIYDFNITNYKFTKPYIEFIYFEDYDSEANNFFNGTK